MPTDDDIPPAPSQGDPAPADRGPGTPDQALPPRLRDLATRLARALARPRPGG